MKGFAGRLARVVEKESGWVSRFPPKSQILVRNYRGVNAERSDIHNIPYNEEHDLKHIQEQMRAGGVVVASFPMVTCPADKVKIKETMGYVEEHWDKPAHTTCVYWDESVKRFNAATILGLSLKDGTLPSALTVGFQQPSRGFALRDVGVVTISASYNKYKPDINIASLDSYQLREFLRIIEERREASRKAVQLKDGSGLPIYFSASTSMEKLPAAAKIENCQSLVHYLFDSVDFSMPMSIFPPTTLISGIFKELGIGASPSESMER